PRPSRPRFPYASLFRSERLSVAKGERALGAFDMLAGVVNNLPTSVLTRVARQQAETVDFAASNLRAADFDLYIAGALVVANHPRSEEHTSELQSPDHLV